MEKPILIATREILDNSEFTQEFNFGDAVTPIEERFNIVLTKPASDDVAGKLQLLLDIYKLIQ